MFFQLLLAAIGFVIIYWYLIKPKRLPPGPSGIPFLGYLPWILYYSNDKRKLFDKLKAYGNIVSIRVGFSYMIILNDLNNIKEAFSVKGEHFSGRGLKLLQKEITHSKGILTAEGKYQRENRRFILKTLRNMGFGKISFEEPVMDSITKMIEAIDNHNLKHPDQSMDIRQCLTEAVADNISQIVLGVKFNKKQLLFLIERLEMIQTIPPIFFMVTSFPFINPFLYFEFFKKLVGVDKFKEIRIPFQDMVMEYVKNHKETFDQNNITDFIYSYIDEQKNHQNTEEESFWWDDEQIKHACTDLLAAGTGTTEATISWFLFYMAKNQEWQEKIASEIDLKIGNTRHPLMKDLPNLPLCEATILETLRYSSLADTGIPHFTTENTSLQGYFIPKNSIVMSNLMEVARNADNFIDPFNFNPAANFLNETQNEIINRDKIISFGVGRRSCIGESLARMEITLFFIALFQKYTVSLDPIIGMPKIGKAIFRVLTHRVLKFTSRV